MKRLIAVGVVIVVAVGVGSWAYVNRNAAASTPNIAQSTVPYYGVHQAGIETPAQANATFIALDLKPDMDAADATRLLKTWTNSAAKLTNGEPILGDSIVELAENPASLTVTVGFGYSLFAKTGMQEAWPLEITDLPHFTVDKLEQRWSGGDFVIQVAGDNPLSIFHAVHELTRDAAPYAKVRWQQRGFLNPAGIDDEKIGRNLMGQIDGTANAAPGSPEFADRTWSTAPASLAGGSTLVLRRIQMQLDTWDVLGPGNKELVIGREHSDGSKLETIGPKAHVGLSFTENNQGITRRGYNYDDGYTANGVQDAGLIFASYQSQIDRFISIQRALDAMDELNRWTTPVGSALFIVPPGTSEGRWIGDTFFTG